MSDRGFRYVLAYGSNLCLERMKRRCPSSRVVGTADIPGYRLLFKKSLTGAYATIEQDANWTVPVVVYRISASDELRLDRFEGCPTYYYKRRFALRVRRNNGRKTTPTSCTRIGNLENPTWSISGLSTRVTHSTDSTSVCSMKDWRPASGGRNRKAIFGNT